MPRKFPDPDAPVLDPWAELHRERKAHRETLRMLDVMYSRARTRNGLQQWSTTVCKLCAHPPMGAHPVHWRRDCPCRAIPGYVARERDRLIKAVTRVERPRVAVLEPEPDDATA